MDESLIVLTSQNGFSRFLQETDTKAESQLTESALAEFHERGALHLGDKAGNDNVLQRTQNGSMSVRQLQRRRMLWKHWCHPNWEKGISSAVGRAFQEFDGYGSAMAPMELHEKLQDAAEEFKREKQQRNLLRSLRSDFEGSSDTKVETMELGQVRIFKLLPMKHVIVKYYLGEVSCPDEVQFRVMCIVKKVEKSGKKRIVLDPDAPVMMMMSTTTANPLKKDCQWSSVKRLESDKPVGNLDPNWAVTQDILVTPKGKDLQFGKFHWIRLQNSGNDVYKVEVTISIEDYVDIERVNAEARASEALIQNLRGALAESEKRRECIMRGQDWKETLSPEFEGISLDVTHVKAEKHAVPEPRIHKPMERRKTHAKELLDQVSGVASAVAKFKGFQKKSINDFKLLQAQAEKEEEKRVRRSQKLVAAVFLPVLERSIKNCTPEPPAERGPPPTVHECQHLIEAKTGQSMLEDQYTRSRSRLEIDWDRKTSTSVLTETWKQQPVEKVAFKVLQSFKAQKRNVTIMRLEK